jgi:hypothetical protein
VTLFLTLDELVKWLGLAVFEFWLHVTFLLVFSFLVVLRLENAVPTYLWNVFIPLFIADGLNT